MDNIKPWQIILIFAAFAVLGFSVWWQFSKGSVQLPDSVLVVDVTNGDLYDMKLGKRNGGYFPERSPSSGKHVLMPVHKDDSGEWFIVGHAMPALADVEGELKVVDASSGRVTLDSEEVIDTIKAGG